MTPEARARLKIDKQLADAGWLVQDLKTANLGAAQGVAVREYPTDAGPADYLLFVDRRPLGVIEAKREEAGQNLTFTEPQTERYASARLKWTTSQQPLTFLFEATGQIVRFTDNHDPAPLEAVRRMRDQLEACDSLEAAIDKGSAQCAAQRQNILRAAFAGQLVPQDPTDEPTEARWPASAPAGTTPAPSAGSASRLGAPQRDGRPCQRPDGPPGLSRRCRDKPAAPFPATLVPAL